MRVFLAVDVDASARATIAEAVDPHRHDRRLAWTRPEGWHVTLAFVGEVDDDALGLVESAARAGVEAAAIEQAPALTTARATVLGRGVLAIALDDDPGGALQRLGAALQHALDEAGLPVHRRDVTAHLTVARARGRRTVPREVVERLEVPTVSWRVDRVTVVESVLGRGPATYRAVTSVPLPSGEGRLDTGGRP